MHRERLEQVVRVLKELPEDKKFDLSGWMTCGTVGCAIGWCGLDPWFNKEGLSLREFMQSPDGDPVYTPVHYEACGDRAVMNFLDIQFMEFRALFLKESYDSPTKEAVIERLEEFLSSHKG